MELQIPTPNEYLPVLEPIDGDSKNKHLLSMMQLGREDILHYVDEATAADKLIEIDATRGIDLLPYFALKAVMRQPSTRTGGSMTTAMQKLGGSADLISGMTSSSEAKGESLEDSWVAFATQADIIGTRTSETYGPHQAANAIDQSYRMGSLRRRVQVINLGDGTNEHPTQTLGDLFAISKWHGGLDDLTITIIGDHERYRAHHSLMIAAYAIGASVVAIESSVAKVPEPYAAMLGDKLSTTDDLDGALSETKVLYIGRNPDEYTGRNRTERRRSKQLAKDYERWVIDYDRLQNMPRLSGVFHPRPRRNELNPDTVIDKRMKDVIQMEKMIPMRMAILALHLGFSISDHMPTV